MLALLLGVAVLGALPRLETRFAFRDFFAPGHPARDAYDAFEVDFEQGAPIQLFFHGDGVFQAPFLRDLKGLADELYQLEATRAVFSPIDLVEPWLSGRNQQLARILSDSLLDDPAALEARLREPPFTTDLHGVLYDRERTTLLLSVTPPEDESDPSANRAYMAAVLEPADALAKRHGVRLYHGGYRFLRHEVRRVGWRPSAG